MAKLIGYKCPMCGLINATHVKYCVQCKTSLISEIAKAQPVYKDGSTYREGGKNKVVLVIVIASVIFGIKFILENPKIINNKSMPTVTNATTNVSINPTIKEKNLYLETLTKNIKELGKNIEELNIIVQKNDIKNAEYRKEYVKKHEQAINCVIKFKNLNCPQEFKELNSLFERASDNYSTEWYFRIEAIKSYECNDVNMYNKLNEESNKYSQAGNQTISEAITKLNEYIKLNQK